MKNIILLIAIIVVGAIFIPTSCTPDASDARLIKADSLMTYHPDSAYSILSAINPAEHSSNSDNAYYVLLLTQAKYKNDDTLCSDSLINIALKYYADNHDREKYTRSLLYKGATYVDMQQPEEAMKWYKKAEENADSSDYLNLGMVNMYMAWLYMGTYTNGNLDILRYRKALNYFHKADSKVYQMKCMSNLGGLYRISNMDSAYYYLNGAIALAQELKDSAKIYYNQEMLARAYLRDDLPHQAKAILKRLVNISFDEKYKKDVLYDLIDIYIDYNRIDSAYFYLKQLNLDNQSLRDEMMYYDRKSRINQKEKDYKSALFNEIKADSLAIQILSNSRDKSLYLVERKYDNAKIELENALLERHIMMLYFICACVLIGVLVTILIVKRRLESLKEKKLLIAQLEEESLKSRKALIDHLDSESKLKSILENQMSYIRQLVTEYGSYGEDMPTKFITKFKEAISANKMDMNLFADLKLYVNQKFNNIISRLEIKYPNLKEDELTIICLMYCGFSYIEIGVCMGYTNNKYVINKRLQISRKIGISTPLAQYLTDIIKELKDTQEII